jgi:hypothetical protein
MSEAAPQRDRKRSTEKDLGALSKGSKRVCLPIEQKEYDRIFLDPIAFRQLLDPLIAQHPELFPQTIAEGYVFHAILPPSKKMPDVRLRRIQVNNPQGEVFTIAPSFVFYLLPTSLFGRGFSRKYAEIFAINRRKSARPRPFGLFVRG